MLSRRALLRSALGTAALAAVPAVLRAATPVPGQHPDFPLRVRDRHFTVADQAEADAILRTPHLEMIGCRVDRTVVLPFGRIEEPGWTTTLINCEFTMAADPRPGLGEGWMPPGHVRLVQGRAYFYAGGWLSP